MAPKTAFSITYKKAGTSPPVFLAGSFSDPQWELQEMQYTRDEDGEHTFQSEVMVEAGKDYQFKLRVGEGDWWVLAENYPVATDGSGNQNNLLSVPDASAEVQIAPASVNTPAINVDHDAESGSSSQEADSGNGETDDTKIPLFAHECLGAYDFGDGDSDQEASLDSSTGPEQHTKPKPKKYETPDIDVNDPTLEKFPEDRTSILGAIRAIQTHLDEDHTHLEDIPSSPRVVSTRRTSVDSTDELSLSPAPLSPTATRRRESRLSHSSFGRTRSAVSLGSIAEEPKPGTDKQPQNAPVVSLPNPNMQGTRAGVKSPPSEEDEAVVMKASEVKPNGKTNNGSLSQLESNEAQHDEPGMAPSAPAGSEVSSTIRAQETGGGQADGTASAGLLVEDQTPASARPGSASHPQDNLDASASISKEVPKATVPAGDAPRSSRRSVLPMIVTTGALAVAIGIGWWQSSDYL
ncbi:hypothetical protein ACJ41O_004233 [Fusarium nematophilum]